MKVLFDFRWNQGAKEFHELGSLEEVNSSFDAIERKSPPRYSASSNDRLDFVVVELLGRY